MNLRLGHIQIFILLSVAFAPWSLGRAQDSESGQTPSPTPPYVAALTGNFSLVKKITYPPPAAPANTAQPPSQDPLIPPSKKMVELDAVDTGTVRKDTLTFSDGSSQDIWRLQSYRFSVSPAHPDSVIIDVVTAATNPGASYQYQDAADFSELNWITAATYQGIQMRGGKKCYAYKLDDQTAWIDAATRLPVYFKSKVMQVTYTWSGPPDAPLQLPSNFTDKLAKFKRAQRGQL
jgi:hypothetical protein